ncbi:MAG TPA: LysR family transcriptional regulator [Candidatus Ventrimonas merdavium]|nr:LysR family transcriptional regulator [Candidatus Ventrimonas merdavium]
MNTKQLITFMTLVQEKNYLKTSEKLNYAPSTLAKHIHALEDELQTQLVEYRSGKIEMTCDGKRFMRYADEMLSIYFKVQNEFQQVKTIGSIRVAGGELMVGFSFGEFFVDVETKRQDISLKVNAICCARVPEWLNQNEVDIGFVQTLDPQAGDDGQQTVPLFEERLCLMVSPDHPLARQKEVRMSDLDRQNFSYTYEDCCFTDEFRRCLTQSGSRPSSELFLGSIHAVINTVQEGDRICLIPYVCVPKVRQMGLVELNWVDGFQIYDVILIQKGVYRSHSINCLIRMAREYVQVLKRREETKEIVIL